MDTTKIMKGSGMKPNVMDNRFKDASFEAEGFIQLNVSGNDYITLKETLEEFPSTLLGSEERRRKYFVKSLNAYFFDRNRDCFEAILYYYQSGGTLFRPTHIPMDVFVQEARFFGISEDVLSNLHKLEGYAIEAVGEEKELKENFNMGKWQRKLWLLMDSPDSSLSARIIGCWSILIIIISITTFCLETLPEYHSSIYVGQHPSSSLFVTNTSNTTSEGLSVTQPTILEVFSAIEVVSVIWFCLEYILRFTSSPNKWVFFKSFLNLIDLVAIMPFFIVILIKHQTGSSLAVVRVARLSRILRIFKLSRHSMGLQILGSTLRASMTELGMMLCVIWCSVILFSRKARKNKRATQATRKFSKKLHGL